MHWSGAFATAGRVNALVPPRVDPLSGQPELKHATATIAPYRTAWQACLFSRRPLALDELGAGYTTRLLFAPGAWRYELAGDTAPEAWESLAKALLSPEGAASAWLSYEDRGGGQFRYAAIAEDRLQACLFIARDHRLPDRAWLAELFAKPILAPQDRLALLAGAAAPGRNGREASPIICSCFSVSQKRIAAAISGEGLASVEAIGASLRAGTNCGSCIPELKAMLRA
jgi:assimilatory nitrate reductase catalytic subunit